MQGIFERMTSTSFPDAPQKLTVSLTDRNGALLNLR